MQDFRQQIKDLIQRKFSVYFEMATKVDNDLYNKDYFKDSRQKEKFQKELREVIETSFKSHIDQVEVDFRAFVEIFNEAVRDVQQAIDNYRSIEGYYSSNEKKVEGLENWQEASKKDL